MRKEMESAFLLSADQLDAVARNLALPHPDLSIRATRIRLGKGRSERVQLNLSLYTRSQTQIGWAQVIRKCAGADVLLPATIRVGSGHEGERGKKCLRLLEVAVRDFASEASRMSKNVDAPTPEIEPS